ncbi:MAG TPA: hypothetical protein VK670_16680 [Silvibacterium sp.]|nr:hypothetical protein [Silvibacterium sp.]
MKFCRPGMAIRLAVAPLLLVVISGIQAQDQHPLIDMLAQKVVQKYQTTPCAELKMKKAEKAPPSAQEQKIIAYLRSDPQSRKVFIDKVAAPIANKMFECGMIP